MNNRTFTQDLLGVQNDLLRFAYKLTSDREEANDLLQETSLKALDNEEKYTPDTNFKGWIYTIMRNIFINNYRKVVRDQTFVDTTDNLYHLKHAARPHTRQHRRRLRPEGNAPHCQCLATWVQDTFLHACLRFQVPWNRRKAEPPTWNSKEPHLLYPPETATGTERFQIREYGNLRIVY